MPLTVSKKGKTRPAAEALRPRAFSGPARRISATPEQMRLFGQLNMRARAIADYYGESLGAVQTLMTDPVLRAAYQKGRANCEMNVRQTQLQVALGVKDKEGNYVVPPDRSMLMYVGKHFAQQAEPDDPDDDVAHGHDERDEIATTWLEVFEARAAELAREIEAEDAEEVPASGPGSADAGG